MKLSRKLAWPLLLLCLLITTGATIKLFTDYPNSPSPVSTDFLLFQRGGSYVNSAQSQYLPTWFNNPVFTGNGSINGAFNVGGSLTVGGAVITGVTYYGDGSGLSNVATQVYLKTANDFGTNETFLNTTFDGVSIFDQINANLFYPTNLFTGLTNVQALGTDGNGLLIVGASTITNVTITNAFIQNLTNNTFFNTNLFISTSNAFFNNTYITNLTTVNETNNTFVNTNLFISTSNAFFTNNTFINTNFSTNLYFVSGKGNTLIITNNFSVGGVQTNLNIAASSAVITKSDQVLTNAVNAHGVFTNSATGPPSFGLLQNTELVNSSITIQGSAVALGGTTLAVGSSPTFNLVNSTNLTVQYVTNVSPANSTLTFAQAYETNLTSDVTIVGFSMGNAFYETLVYSCTNSSGSDHKVTMPAGVVGIPGSGTPPVYYCTNKLGCDIYISHFGNRRTNAWKIDWAP